MADESEWNPDTVDLLNMRQIDKYGTIARKVFKVEKFAVYTLSIDISPNVHDKFSYNSSIPDK